MRAPESVVPPASAVALMLRFFVHVAAGGAAWVDGTAPAWQVFRWEALACGAVIVVSAPLLRRTLRRGDHA
jgi:hypothetical protein